MITVKDSYYKNYEAHDGLLLVCGPTGSGKSFTLACCIDYIKSDIGVTLLQEDL